MRINSHLQLKYSHLSILYFCLSNKNIEYAYSVAADTRIALGENFSLTLRAQTGGQWLENQFELQLDYNSNNWIKDSVFTISILQTEYNLESYNHDDTTAPDFLPILPWNEDTLLQAYIVIPWNF